MYGASASSLDACIRQPGIEQSESCLCITLRDQQAGKDKRFLLLLDKPKVLAKLLYDGRPPLRGGKIRGRQREARLVRKYLPVEIRPPVLLRETNELLQQLLRLEGLVASMHSTIQNERTGHKAGLV